MTILLSSICHFLTDAICAATIYGQLIDKENILFLVMLYNTLAFVTQCLVGLLADKLMMHFQGVALSAIMLAAGFFIPGPAILKIILIGLGNSLFHVAGGTLVIERSKGKASYLGMFVAPGAFGVILGTLFPSIGIYVTISMMVLSAAILFMQNAPSEADGPTAYAIIRPKCSIFAVVLSIVLLTCAVIVRAIGGSAVSFPWKQGTLLTLITVGCVFAGKFLGGFIMDKIGPLASGIISLLPAAVLIAFCSDYMVPSLIGQFLLNLTMPVTLWLLVRAMPTRPSFAFGLAATALFPGTYIGQSMLLTGPNLWICVMISFMFGLFAIIYGARILLPARNKKKETEL